MPLFFSKEALREMNELVISTYIKIMKDGFVEHDRQESAARFLLESISMQEEANIMTNIDSKKSAN